MKKNEGFSDPILKRDHFRSVCNLNDYENIDFIKEYPDIKPDEYHIDNQDRCSYIKPEKKGKDEIFIHNRDTNKREPLSKYYEGLINFKMNYKRLYVEKGKRKEVREWMGRESLERKQ